jgi:hypothetical protein
LTELTGEFDVYHQRVIFVIPGDQVISTIEKNF